MLVFGAGSIGSFIGGMLAASHDVTLVGREPHVSAIAESGLAVTGCVERRTWPAARTDTQGYAGDIGIVTVKAYDTIEAARALGPCELDCVVSLQNGMGNESVLASRLDASVVGGTVTYGAVLRDPGGVACTGLGTITLGTYAGDTACVERVREAFTTGGLECSMTGDIESVLWEKLAMNAGINPVTALSRVTNGELLESPLYEVARDATLETAQVARNHDVSLSDVAAEESLRDVVEQTAANESSMYRDVQNGRRTEIDAINGYVVQNATNPVPTNAVLTALISGWETTRGLRSDDASNM